LPEKTETRCFISRRNLAPTAAFKVLAPGEFAFSALIIEPHDTAIVLEGHLAAWTVVDSPILVTARHFEIRPDESVTTNLDRILV